MLSMLLTTLEKAYSLKSKQVPIKYKKWKNSRPKHCYDNCWEFLVQNQDKKSSSSTKYVLGFLVLNDSIPIEHAWIKHKDLYYDITLSDDKKFTQTYHVFVELSFKETANLAQLCGYVPDLLAYARYKRRPRLDINDDLKQRLGQKP